jgi:hypothetical protein
LNLGDAYDDYEGKVKCFVCRALLTIRTCDGQLKSIDLFAGACSAGPPPRVELSIPATSAHDLSAS